MIMEVAGGIGKRGEDEDLPVGLAVAVDGGLADLGLDELLQLGELAVTPGGDGLGLLDQELKLGAVVAHRLEPFRQLKMGEVDAAMPADGEILLVEIRILKLIRSQRVVVDLGILIEVLLKGGDALLQPINLV